MMKEGSQITDLELHAYLDGELDAGEAARVSAGIAASPALSKRLALYRQDKERIAAVYGPLIDLPPARQGMRRRPVRPMQWLPSMRSVAAATVAVAIVLTVLLVPPRFFPRPAVDGVVAEAMAARSGQLVPQRELGVTASAEPARERTFRDALGVAIKTPDLQKAGLRLTRASYFATNGALQLSYRDADNRLFTVYLHRPSGGDRFELHERGAMRICIWQNEDLSAVMLGEMSTSQMLRTAALTYSALNF